MRGDGFNDAARRARRRLGRAGAPELRRALAALSGLFLVVGLFSMLVNLLMLTGPLFMLQVYDRVLTSRSAPTLLVLFLLAGALFLGMGLLDHARARVLARAGARFQSRLDGRVFAATLAGALDPEARARPAGELRDLEAIQRLLSGPAPFALFDAPWTPIYLGAIFLFHPWLGWLATGGALVLALLAILNEASSRRPQATALAARGASDALEGELRRQAETLSALGMRAAAAARWREGRDTALAAQIEASDRSGGYAAASKTLRLFLQSAMLALGALLAIRGEITPGVMIAASILAGRALAPVEQAIAQWEPFQRARSGWRQLADALAAAPEPPPRPALPAPAASLEVEGLAAGPPGAAAPLIAGLSFSIAPGEALGVIGPSGAGKSTLARALAGIWPPMRGEIRLDGAAIAQWEPDALGAAIGYLPQEAELIDGSVAENIARLAPDPDMDLVLDAARRAGVHDAILRLPEGYGTRVGAGGGALSGGQRARVALARALYGDPALVILDEPNAHLDAEGERALRGAVEALTRRGRAVALIAHRPSAIGACHRLLMLEDGRQRAFGPRDAVLRETVANASDLIGGAPEDRS